MSANEGLYQELRHAHQSALCNARLRAAELNFDAPDAPCLDWFRFRVATDHFFPELMPGENRELYLENLAWRDLKKFEFSRTDDLEAAGLLTCKAAKRTLDRPSTAPFIWAAGPFNRFFCCTGTSR